MASSSDDDDFITVVCTNPEATPTTAAANTEVFVSVTDIESWDLPAILSCRSLKVKAHRNRLVRHSSYFRGLLAGSFSESGLDYIAIEWNLKTFVDVLNCIYGCDLDVTFDNFLSLIEGALYFGVEKLLMRCKTWFSEVASLEVPPQIQLDDLICIWSFGLEHACEFVPELCASYLARNFVCAKRLNLCLVSVQPPSAHYFCGVDFRVLGLAV